MHRQSEHPRTMNSTSPPNARFRDFRQLTVIGIIVAVLGPIPFLLYTADLIKLVESHNLSPHLYAG